ncbi:hypothetical protein CTEN210_04073 [Chaetoceros tenuissimus]|uniref:Uncharacterized protein n=1 Tax=Chaetoceros tenuissimus TaxID=426638 RepID=A0AAD3H2E8_9STRA|nr:hypothetical protein CTEN210_04073 [Chaetoceros tenuissimus]
MTSTMSNKRLKVARTSDTREKPLMSIIDLPNDLLKHCFSFVPGSYITIAPVSKQFFQNYCTVGMDDSNTVNSADTLLKIGRNKRTTADAVSSDLYLTELSFISNAPNKFMNKVCQKAIMKGRKDIIECATVFGVDFEREVFGERYRPNEDADITDSASGETHLMLGTLAEEGNLDMLKYLFERFSWLWLGDIKSSIAVEAASIKGHLHILRWFQEKVEFFTRSGYETLEIQESIDGAILNGHFHILRWLADCGTEYLSNSWYHKTAASSGSVEMIKFIQEKTHPQSNETVFAAAAESGSIEMLEYYHENNCPFDSSAYHDAFENKDKAKVIQTLKFLHQHGCRWDEKVCELAAKTDNLCALKFARSKGCPWNPNETVNSAAMSGSIEILEYCLENGCELSADLCTFAMHARDDLKALETLKWLRQRSCLWNYQTCYQAINHDNYDAFIWARNNGCEMDFKTLSLAMFNTSIPLMEHCLANKDKNRLEETRDKNDTELYKSIHISRYNSSSKTIEKLRLLRKYDIQWDASVCEMAARSEDLRVLQWLRFYKCPWNANICNIAVRRNNFELLKYAHENGCEWNKDTYAYCFESSGLRNKKMISTKPRPGLKKILKYLEENNCPRT